jgi:hypothetical protein
MTIQQINITTEYKAGRYMVREERDRKNNTNTITVFDDKNNIVCSFDNWTQARDIAFVIENVSDSILTDTHTEYGTVCPDSGKGGKVV